MGSVLFFDPVCQRPYDTRTLGTQALGGTESSVVRVADALGAWVQQHNRTDAWERYLPPQPLPGIERVVLVRDSRALPRLRELFPDARYYLWIHDLINPGSRRARWLAGTARWLRELRVTLVCVSDWQRAGVEATLRGMGLAGAVRAVTIHNAIDGGLVPDATPVDPDKLVFFSSPNKGLAFALDAFGAVRRALPGMRLVVGNPGYKADRSARLAGVEFLGPLPQPGIHAQVRSSLCTFSPNFLIPETFGLVFAESMALGTPVLTVACGAASEVIADPQQVLPMRAAWRVYEGIAGAMPSAWRRLPARLADAAGLFDSWVERIAAWRDGGRPRVGPDPRFMLPAVAAQWRALLSHD